MKLNIRLTSGAKHDITFEENNESTIKDLKKSIEEQIDIPKEEQRLIYAGRIMKDFNTVKSYNIKEGAAVHLVRGVKSKTTTAPRNQSNNTQTPFNQQTNNNNNNNNNTNNSSGFNIPNSFAQRNTRNNNIMGMDPEAMRNAMQNPFMQQLMANPEFMRNIMMNNPQTRRMIQDHPELEQILTSPETMRQMTEIASDPDRLQEMMRTFDLQLNQIESMPGGYSLLQRYLGGHQDEGFDTPNNESTPQDHNANNNNNNDGPVNTSSLPNPWASGSSQQQQSNNNNNNNTTNNANPFANLLNNPMGGNMMGNMMGNPMGGGMNMQDTMQMMQNPMMRQMMDNILSNPDMLRQMTQNNPMFANNPGMRQMVENPEMMRNMMNMMYGPPTTNNNNNTNNTQQQQQQQPNWGNMFQNMMQQQQQQPNPFGGFGGFGGFPQQQQQMPSHDQLQQRYGAQLEQLRSMGFYDDQKNGQALHHTNGNVSAAVDWLLNHP